MFWWEVYGTGLGFDKDRSRLPPAISAGLVGPWHALGYQVEVADLERRDLRLSTETPTYGNRIM